MGVKSALLIAAGFISLALGAIGIFLPILPTTPFVLLASGCFAGSSPRLYQRLADTKFFGGYVRHYHTKSGVSKKDKLRALVFLWCVLILSALVFQNALTRIILIVVGISVSAHIALLKNSSQ